MKFDELTGSKLNGLLGWPGPKGQPGEIYRLTIDFDTNGEFAPELTILLPQKMLSAGLACDGLSIAAHGNTVIRASMWRKHANGRDIDMLTPNVELTGAPKASKLNDGFGVFGGIMSDDEINELREQIKVMQQTLLEVSHAQQNGSNWYTRGESGLYQQVSMWIRRGQDAINKATEILTPNDI